MILETKLDDFGNNFLDTLDMLLGHQTFIGWLWAMLGQTKFLTRRELELNGNFQEASSRPNMKYVLVCFSPTRKDPACIFL